MKYLDFLTKEELIEAMQKALSEDKLYEIVYEALEKRGYLLYKKAKPIRDELKKGIDTDKEKFFRSKEYDRLDKLLNKINQEDKEISEIRKEVYFMMQHRRKNKNDNRSYEEIKEEEERRSEEFLAQIIKEYEARMEEKYG